MNDEVKKMWLDALRSGKYKQGSEVLHRNDPTGEERFCCLGVLCDIAVKHNVVLRATEERSDGGHNVGFAYGDEEAVTGLPKEVIKWAGFPTEIDDRETWTCFTDLGDPSLAVKDYDGVARNRHVSFLNDSGWTFGEIALLIEEQF